MVHEASEEQVNSHIFGQRDSQVSLQQGEGGVRTRSVPLNRLTLNILIFCQDHGIFLIPTYLPGVANQSVDALSRGQESKKGVVPESSGGQQDKQVDLFASLESAHLLLYFSIYRKDRREEGSMLWFRGGSSRRSMYFHLLN